eukprot:SAG31_NODE_1363_length_8627_cov_5.967402_11_plen_61_part_00
MQRGHSRLAGARAEADPAALTAGVEDRHLEPERFVAVDPGSAKAGGTDSGMNWDGLIGMD